MYIYAYADLRFLDMCSHVYIEGCWQGNVPNSSGFFLWTRPVLTEPASCERLADGRLILGMSRSWSPSNYRVAVKEVKLR